jgi:hypothetical protein
LQSEGHGHDTWVPVSLELGNKASVQNGNGHHEVIADQPIQANVVDTNRNVMDLKRPGSNLELNGSQVDSSVYDAIRKSNTASDAVEEEFGSDSASCGLPTRDYPLKAYAQDGEAISGLPDEDEDGTQSQFIKLGNFVLPRKKMEEDKTPVEAD